MEAYEQSYHARPKQIYGLEARNPLNSISYGRRYYARYYPNISLLPEESHSRSSWISQTSFVLAMTCSLGPCALGGVDEISCWMLLDVPQLRNSTLSRITQNGEARLGFYGTFRGCDATALGARTPSETDLQGQHLIIFVMADVDLSYNASRPNLNLMPRRWKDLMQANARVGNSYLPALRCRCSRSAWATRRFILCISWFLGLTYTAAGPWNVRWMTTEVALVPALYVEDACER
jgi:hypothetical protein